MTEGTVDSLQVEVTVLSDKAIASLNRLKDTLNGLKPCVGTAPNGCRHSMKPSDRLGYGWGMVGVWLRYDWGIVKTRESLAKTTIYFSRSKYTCNNDQPK